MAPKMAKLMTEEGEVDTPWDGLVAKAKTYLDKFEPNDEVYKCESAHFASQGILKFSSEKNRKAFGDDTVELDGGILMGLDEESATGAVTLDKVLGNFGVVVPEDNSLYKIITLLEEMGLIEIDANRPGNGYWILPKIEEDKESLEVATRLAYKITAGGAKAAKDIFTTLFTEFGLDVRDPPEVLDANNFAIILTDIVTLAADSEPDIVATITVRIISLKNFVFYISQTNGQRTFALRQDSSPSSSTETQVAGLRNFVSIPTPDELIPGDIFESIQLWYADFDIETKDWVVALALILPISTLDDGKVPIYLKYEYDKKDKKKKFSGGLLRGDLPEESNILLPTYREYHGLPEKILAANDQASGGIDLALAYDFTRPKGLPTILSKANISYERKGTEGASELLVEVELVGGEDDKETDPPGPPSPFTWDKAAFKFEKKGAENPIWNISSEFTLKSPGSTGEDGKLFLELRKSGTELNIVGKAESINFAMLGSFFEPQYSEAIVSILGKIKIASLNVDYTYNSSGKASDFLFSGDINIGKLKLDFFYQYASSIPDGVAAAGSKKRRDDLLTARRTRPASRGIPARTGPPAPPLLEVPKNKDTDWQFDASLSAAEEGENLGTIIESICGDNPLPSFISNIDVPTTGEDVTNGKPLISLKVAKMDDNVVFVFNVALAFLEFSFIQISNKKGTNGSVVPPLRILRFSIGSLPFIQDIPIVKELPQPYQLLTYCYVGGPVGSKGVTKAQINTLNSVYIPNAKIFYKAVTQGQEYVLRLGHHFIVINNDECILDHVFGAKPAPPRAAGGGSAGAITAGNTRNANASLTDTKNLPAEDTQSSPTKGTLQKKSKFLTITGISVQYKNETLWLFIDATLAMGPVELSLIGFGIGLKLGGANLKLNDLVNTFNMTDLDFQINGIAMNFDQPPILIAGVFIHEVTESINSYRGGIAVGFKPYEFVAVGEYAEVTDPVTKEKYKSIFLYAKLDGPLIDLQIAIIKGVRLGFGYNSFVRSPQVHELADFPFISDSGISEAGNNPMKILEGMRGGVYPWVAPKQDSFWFAVGFSVSAFNLLTATAVALVGFSDEGVVINILADVVCMMPPEAPSRDMCIVYVELLMNAELNFIHDYFFVQAALAPTSFLLVPQCHLYGGFAMGTWFGRSDYAGDWVFTVGGYHRNFVRPAHYPRPDRLGIRFNIGDNISIRGEGYFAITPKAVMGGAMIKIQLSVGPVSAHLDAAFDALLYFDPLHYIVDVYVEVGVSCRIHLLFVSFDISIEIGADLHIEGPEFGGVAHVDFWFFGFDIYFGEQASGPPPLTLLEFYNVVAKAGPPENPPEDKQDNVEDDFIVQLKLSLEEGAAPAPVEDTAEKMPPPNAGFGSKWRVRGGDFKFRVSSVFAITSATLETKESVQIEKTSPLTEKSLEQKVIATETVNLISSIPMQAHPGTIDSQMSIKIIKEDAKPSDLNEMYPSGWQPEFVVKLVPTALWGDPAHPPNALDSKDGCVPQQMAVSIAAPLPLLAVSKIPKVKATELARLRVQRKSLAETETQDGMGAATLKKTPDTWETMQSAWEDSVSKNLSTAEELVKGCMKTLGWDLPAPEVVQKAADLDPKPWVLNVKMPVRLVSGNATKVEGVEDGLDNFYLALPRVCVV